jgi:hypothetical protein
MPFADSSTVYGIINDAMHDAGLLRLGQLPTSQHVSDYSRTLADVINLWQTQGLKLFLWYDVAVPLVAGQGEYTFGPTGDVVMEKPLTVLQGYVLDTNDIRRPLVALSWNEWMTLSQTEGNDGQISSYFVDTKPLLLHVHFWNTPDATQATSTGHLLMRCQATRISNLEDNILFPPEWRIALRWALADEICTGQPDTIMNRCSSRAKRYKQELEDFDVEQTSTQFQPDQQMFTGYGRFT